MDRAYSLLTVKAVDDDTRMITGMATTPTPDRMQDVVEPRGAQFKLPIPFLWQHDSGHPIGHVTHAKVSAAGIEIVAKIAKGVTAEIDRAWALIKGGLVSGLSIGFKADRARNHQGNQGNPLHQVAIPRTVGRDDSGQQRGHHCHRQIDRHCAAGRVRPQRCNCKPARRLGTSPNGSPPRRAQDENHCRANQRA